MCSSDLNVNRLSDGIDRRSANAILIKPNQIGTVTETLECIEMAKSNGFGTVMSHRSGELTGKDDDGFALSSLCSFGH